MCIQTILQSRQCNRERNLLAQFRVSHLPSTQETCAVAETWELLILVHPKGFLEKVHLELWTNLQASQSVVTQILGWVD